MVREFDCFLFLSVFQDAGESGISGVVVALVDDFGNIVQFTTTNNVGIYYVNCFLTFVIFMIRKDLTIYLFFDLPLV